MASIHIKNITLGEGLPKICVPLTDRSLTELESSLNSMRDKHFDLIEWRVDKFEAFRQHIAGNASVSNMSAEATNSDAACISYCIAKEDNNDTSLASKSIVAVGTSLKEAAALIRSSFPDKPIIFTIRTKRDMEDFEISDEAYADAISYAACDNLGDIIDIEYSRGTALVSELVDLAKKNGVNVIISKHLAEHTPTESEIINTLHDMQETKADIVKLAVMPQSRADVITLLNATYKYASEPDSVPVITMSMGKLGVLSRLSGSLTGSCLTFGTVGAASAPGQIDCEELKRILNILA